VQLHKALKIRNIIKRNKHCLQKQKICSEQNLLDLFRTIYGSQEIWD